jgi:soluble lytic murein transglycosylase-like protein
MLIADHYRLPPQLITAIIKVESGGNPFAIRYEPDFVARYLNKLTIKGIDPCSDNTERLARGWSWGLMQIMGQTAREMGFNEPYLSALCDPDTGIEWGCKLLAKKRDLYLASHGWPGVISAYNAGIPKLDSPYVEQVRTLWNP